MMNVEMNASQVNGNQVSYVKFDLSGVDRQENKCCHISDIW